MQYRFNAEEWKTLSTAERIRRCHLWAKEATVLAETASPQLKKAYLGMAKEWLKLAQEIETYGHPPTTH